MAKRVIPINLKNDCIEIYEEVLAKEQTDSIAVRRISQFLKEREIEINDRTIYTYLSRWKKEASISCITEAFETDLSWQNDYIKEAGERLFKRFCDADDDPKCSGREIRDWFSCLRDCIETGIKIDVIRTKKTTKVDTLSTAKIIVENNEI